MLTHVHCTKQGVLRKTPTRVLLQNVLYFGVCIGANKKKWSWTQAPRRVAGV